MKENRWANLVAFIDFWAGVMDTSAIDPQSMRQYKETSGEASKDDYVAI